MKRKSYSGFQRDLLFRENFEGISKKLRFSFPLNSSYKKEC